jgi:hypothetical protein
LRITNKFNLPEPVMKALTQDSYSRGESDRSVTQLIDSPRKQILCRFHQDEIEEDCTDRLWSVFGTAVHNIFEDYGDIEHIAEERLFFDVDGWRISGAIDLQKGSHIMDYKVTSVWSVIYDKPEWHNQLNAYAWLVEHAKAVKINKLTIVAVLRDWKNREAETRQGDYPESPIVLVDIPLWDKNIREQYMAERISLHQKAEFDHLTGEELPLCTDQERWLKPKKFAVKKPKNKRADRVFDTQQEAEDYIANPLSSSNLVIEERVSEPIRCNKYCDASPWCTQQKEWLENEG